MQLFKSTVLRAIHGFPSRDGGVSEGAFRSLNASHSVGDRPEAVAENLRRLAEAANTSELLTITQVHGDALSHDRAGVEADGIWTGRPHVALGIRTADCLPVLIEDRAGRRVAAVHAGWRGVLGLIAVKMVERFAELGSPKDQLRVALGPAIQRCCFEVDGEVPTRFEAAFGPRVVVSGFAKPHLDLSLAVRLSLEAVGVLPEHIEALPQCTHCDGRFFSHRRDRGVTGRHLSFITCAFETDL